MSTEHTADQAGYYEIRLLGRLHPRWTSWFDGLQIADRQDGTTVVSGSVTDQAALHGLLHKVRDVGLPLLSVNRTDECAVDPSASTSPEPERT